MNYLMYKLSQWLKKKWLAVYGQQRIDWLESTLKNRGDNYNNLIEEYADMIRSHPYIEEKPMNIDTYRWERLERRENERLRRYDFALSAVCKNEVKFHLENKRDRSSTVIALYREYGIRIKGL